MIQTKPNATHSLLVPANIEKAYYSISKLVKLIKTKIYRHNTKSNYMSTQKNSGIDFYGGNSIDSIKSFIFLIPPNSPDIKIEDLIRKETTCE